MASATSDTSVFVLGVVATAAAVVLSERVAAGFQSWSGVGLLFVGSALAQFITIAAYQSKRLRRPSWLVGGSLAAGVPPGVLADVLLDSVLFGADRNLFPFEIVVFWVLALAPGVWASLPDDALDRLLGIGGDTHRKP
jgi:hypothetical protein